MEASLPERRFRSAAQYYLAGRPFYSSLLIRRVVELCGLNATHRVLDLGCGPGQLAAAFGPFVEEVIALDPEPEMLEIARKTSGHLNIRFVQGASSDLAPQLGRFQAVTIGRAFHWMERAATLNVLDAMIEPNGAVVLFDDNHPDVPQNSWNNSFRKIIENYSAGDVVRENSAHQSGSGMRRSCWRRPLLKWNAFRSLNEGLHRLSALRIERSHSRVRRGSASVLKPAT